ncbi:nSTAND1 domain-containing NTPase [Nocardia sp. SSK8]|uniref:nSTAND1 domain-containing NTPase n=1 Tax=Nocardia sp. SSK8 TaxID=3120154 RepID=UPI00300BAE73
MTITEPESSSPRALFAQRFAELYAAAGNPTLRRVSAATERRMRGTQASTPSAQRISDWKAGRNVPARFESLLPVVLTLAELAAKTQRELPRRLSEPHEWQRLWQESVTWTAAAGVGDTCPFPGLRAFRAEERALFFGREQATAEFVELVRAATGIVVLIGASGAGKSSLLAAGLRPALDVPTASMTPGTAPSAGLTTALAADPRVLIVDQFEELFTLCPDDTERTDFLTELAALSTRDEHPITVVAALRADFYERCLHYPVLRESLRRTNYLLGPMSMDEISRAITGPAAAAGLTLEQGLEELVRTELRGLGEHTSTDGYDPGALPLLSHVMAATWQQRDGRKLTVAGYRKAGGVAGSVAETAELAWSELTPAQQDAAHELLGALVTVGEDSRDTRRTVDRADLLARSADPSATGEVLEILAAARLLALDAESVQFAHEIVLTAWPRLRGWIEIDRVGHLVRQRLERDAAEWDAAARDSALLYRGTRLDGAREHTRGATLSTRVNAFLHASQRAARIGGRWRIGVAAVVVALLATGVVAVDRSRLADQRTADRDYIELVAAAQRNRTSDPSLSAQLLLAAYRMRPDDATRTLLLNSQDAPLAVTVAAHEGPARMLAVRPTDHLLVSLDYRGNAVFWNVEEPTRPQRLDIDRRLAVDQLVFLPGSTDIVTKGPDGVQLWNLADPRSPRLLHSIESDRDVSIAVDPTGTRLAGVGSTSLTLWDIDDRARPVRTSFTALPEDDHAVEFAPSGELLAISTRGYGTDSANVQLWDIRDRAVAQRIGRPLGLADPDYLADFTFSPDGTQLVVGTFGIVGALGTADAESSRVDIWQIADPSRPRKYETPIRVDNEMMTSLAFHAESGLLAVGSTESIRLWNITEPTRPTQTGPVLSVSPTVCPAIQFASCGGGPNAMLFLPGMPILFSSGDDGYLRSWSLSRATVGTVDFAPSRPVFDREGDRMAILTAKGNLTLWDTRVTERPVRLATITGTAAWVNPALSADGRTLSVHDQHGNQRLVYDLDDPRAPRPLPGWPTEVAGLSTIHGGRMLVTARDAVHVWDITDRAAPVRLGTITSSEKLVYSSTLSPDGTLAEVVLVERKTWLEEFTRQIWSLADPHHPSLVDHADISAVNAYQPSRFMPDNRTLIGAYSDHFGLWDTSSPDAVTPLIDAVHTEIAPLESVSTNRDGTLLAVSGAAGVTGLWDTTDPRAPRRVGGALDPADGRDRRIALHPRGEQLIMVADDGRLGVWDLDADLVAEQICARTGGQLTQAVWRGQVPNVEYRPPCA